MLHQGAVRWGQFRAIFPIEALSPSHTIVGGSLRVRSMSPVDCLLRPPAGYHYRPPALVHSSPSIAAPAKYLAGPRISHYGRHLGHQPTAHPMSTPNVAHTLPTTLASSSWNGLATSAAPMKC